MSAVFVLIARVLAALILYAFLGAALFLLWQTLAAQAAIYKKSKPARLTLRLTLPHSPAQILSLEHTEILIGREADCALQPDDPAVSARHARIFYRSSQWWAEDVGSTNGSLLNDTPLLTPAILVEGDVLQCGHTLLEILPPTEEQDV